MKKAEVQFYEGERKNGKFHGLGMMLLSDGTCYHGEFEDGIENGEATIWFPNGSRYEGT